MIVLAAAVAILHGGTGPLVTVAVLGAAQAIPAWIVLVGLAGWSFRHRPPEDAEVSLLTATTAHLRAGVPLRHALLVSTSTETDLPVGPLHRALDAGVPLAECAPHLEGALPTQGRSAAHALRVAAGTGGRIVPMFDRLAEQAATALDLRRETRAATAAARASALLLAGIPIAIAANRLLAGGLGGLQGALSLGGSALLLLGGAASWAMARRVSP